MHRRQYIPGSHVKVSRRELADLNRRLRRQNEQIAEAALSERERRKKAESETFTAKIRNLIEKTRRVLTRPLFARKTA